MTLSALSDTDSIRFSKAWHMLPNWFWLSTIAKEPLAYEALLRMLGLAPSNIYLLIAASRRSLSTRPWLRKINTPNLLKRMVQISKDSSITWLVRCSKPLTKFGYRFWIKAGAVCRLASFTIPLTVKLKMSTVSGSPQTIYVESFCTIMIRLFSLILSETR